VSPIITDDTLRMVKITIGTSVVITVLMAVIMVDAIKR